MKEEKKILDNFQIQQGESLDMEDTIGAMDKEETGVSDLLFKPGIDSKLQLKMPSFGNLSHIQVSQDEKSISFLKGMHTELIYVGEYNKPNTESNQSVYIRLWYGYFPEENTLWLSDGEDKTEDKISLMLKNSMDKETLINVTSEQSTIPELSEVLSCFCEDLIREAEAEGLSVVRRRKVPEEYENIFIKLNMDLIKPLKSAYIGWRNISYDTIFANALGTTNDPFIDAGGTIHKNPVWIDIWERVLQRPYHNCTYCNAPRPADRRLAGGHVLMGRLTAAIPNPGQQIDIVPLCARHNNVAVTGTMRAFFNTATVVLRWPV